MECLAIFCYCCLIAVGSAAADWKAQPNPTISGKIDLTELSAGGLEQIKDFTAETDGGKWGVLRTHEVVLPGFDKAVFFAHATKKGAWPNMRNQAYPHTLESDDNKRAMADMRDGIVFFILELDDGGYLAVSVMPSTETQSWFHTDSAGRLLLSVGTFGTRGVENFDTPLFTWAKSKDIYAACKTAISNVIESDAMQGGGRLRSDKDLPEPFEYLGWCSWEHFKGSINEANMLEAIKVIKKSEAPVRYVIVDMGHTAQKGGSMTSFAPDKDKFPNGWEPLLKLRDPKDVKWMALWHYFNGCHNGFHPENDFGEEANKHLVPLDKNSLTVKNDPDAALGFYREFIGSVGEYGFDFMKTDFQSLQLSRLAGKVENAIQMCGNNSRAFEESLHERGLGLINCNWHNPINFFNCRYSSVGRVSMDYVKNSLFSSRRHIWQSYANTIWMGHLIWPDHDMFHSNDEMAGKEMAISKAVSGGPIYLSDNPTDFDLGNIRPLCYEDGKLLRPLAPAVPLPESIFLDPYRDEVPYRVIAPLANRSAAIVLYNLKHGGQEPIAVEAAVAPADYAFAGAMLQPYEGNWDMPPEGLVLYDWYAGTGLEFKSELRFELKGLADRLLILAPIRNGWAVIGRTDKYLAAAAVEIVACDMDELRIRMVESGPLAVWSGKGAPTAKGVSFEHLGNGLYKADLDLGEAGRELAIRRGNK
jgi:hypothetical protein